MPDTLPLFETVRDAIARTVPKAHTRVQKSQIAFYATRSFAYAWLPIRPGIKGRPDVYIVVSFGLDHRIHHSRIVDPVEPRPGRWTHHVIISSKTDVNEQFCQWIRSAYEFSERGPKKTSE